MEPNLRFSWDQQGIESFHLNIPSFGETNTLENVSRFPRHKLFLRSEEMITHCFGWVGKKERCERELGGNRKKSILFSFNLKKKTLLTWMKWFEKTTNWKMFRTKAYLVINDVNNFSSCFLISDNFEPFCSIWSSGDFLPCAVNKVFLLNGTRGGEGGDNDQEKKGRRERERERVRKGNNTEWMTWLVTTGNREPFHSMFTLQM